MTQIMVTLLCHPPFLLLHQGAMMPHTNKSKLSSHPTKNPIMNVEVNGISAVDSGGVLSALKLLSLHVHQHQILLLL